ncbi:MAG: hypothetical protein BA861_09075 [Desulfobacterales bacterium S3730MH5]|nr:MAG: hypothetical protein BA861_09075 [Desulfobacterales bacterium S3730MH5]OEU80516.1 MAG: hypothetical protein BA865_05670 [Desulfobacterales bacterium S5133MH4]OEU81766.1 MAG: hypothetical protein BA873_00650 [Desulfobulbaceae bacterium C00003063]
MKLIRFLPNWLRQKRIAQIVRPVTLVGPERIRNLYRLARRIETERIPGDVVECGVFNGGTAAILAHFATRSPCGRSMWLFDSFEGMPGTTQEDGEAAKEDEGKIVGNIEKVWQVLKMVGADLTRVRIVKGWFQDTFPTVKIEQVALLNIDSDWYESVKLCLETFYDAVVPGGYISIDDYGHWPGCKQAVDEFFVTRHLTYKLHQVDYTARWFQKL